MNAEKHDRMVNRQRKARAKHPKGQVCKKCLVLKPWDEYYGKDDYIYGHETKCKACCCTDRNRRRKEGNKTDRFQPERLIGTKWYDARERKIMEMQYRNHMNEVNNTEIPLCGS